MKCPNCESKTITEELQEIIFPYGKTESFPCEVLVCKCGACNTQWLDDRAEESCTLAMFRYEKSIHVQRTVFANDAERALWNQA